MQITYVKMAIFRVNILLLFISDVFIATYSDIVLDLPALYSFLLFCCCNYANVPTVESITIFLFFFFSLFPVLLESLQSVVRKDTLFISGSFVVVVVVVISFKVCSSYFLSLFFLSGKRAGKLEQNSWTLVCA